MSIIVSFFPHPRCKECNKLLNLDTYASHQGVIYCKPHHRELFQPKPVIKDMTEEILSKKMDVSVSHDAIGEFWSQDTVGKLLLSYSWVGRCCQSG